MQLKKEPVSIRAALAAATCSVLAGPASAVSGSGDWDVQAGLLYYEEQDRIKVVEPVVGASKTLQDGSRIALRAVVDTVTGASPNGATATNRAQTFTAPSGNKSYTTPAGEIPLRSLRDERYAFNAELERELSRLVRNTLSAGFSSETDFLSLSIADTITLDSESRQTTYAVGGAFTHNIISPEGGTPRALQLFSAPGGGDDEHELDDDDDGEGEGEDEQRNSVELLLGVTQVFSRRTLGQFNYTLSYSSGYHTDPYKLLSIVAPGTGETLDYLYEKRPDSRTSHIFNWRLNHHFDEDVLYLGYRYFSDDWGINAHTADLKYRSELGGGIYLQPHLRIYRQDAADFFHHSLVNGSAMPRYASADLRLAAMQATTLGLKLGLPLWGGEFSVRVEKMTQEGESHPADAIGIQRSQDLYPTLDAHILQLGYRLRF